VVNQERTSLFLLVFSIATYVRDAGVAGAEGATEQFTFRMQPIDFAGAISVAFYT
jgi:hypothetical protein